MAIKEKKTVETTVNTFTKEQILKSKKYVHFQDLVNVLLLDSRTYTLEEVDKMISDFKKGKVE